MQRFFIDLKTLHAFTMSLDLHQDKLRCQHCAQCDQFVSHGFVYKQRSIEVKEVVAKRIFCSNRNDRAGCGRTSQLYLADTLPAMHYSAGQLTLFITTLLASLNISKAYQLATNQFDTRQAWRWLNKLHHQVMNFRQVIKPLALPSHLPFVAFNKPLQILLSTLTQIFSSQALMTCSQYQLRHQQAFM